MTLVFVNLFKLTYSHDDIEDKFLPLELMYGSVEDKVDLKNWNWYRNTDEILNTDLFSFHQVQCVSVCNINEWNNANNPLCN